MIGWENLKNNWRYRSERNRSVLSRGCYRQRKSIGRYKQLWCRDKNIRSLWLFYKSDIKKGNYFLPALIVGQENQLIVPAKKVTRSIAEMNEEPIFSIFDYDFTQIRSFGKAIRCSSSIAHLHFNLVELTGDDRIIYGAYTCLPIVFAFDRLTGKQIFKRDLALSDIPEINRFLTARKKLWLTRLKNRINQMRFGW